MLNIYTQTIGVAMMQNMLLPVMSSSKTVPHVTVVGGHGALGRELVYQCIQRGWQVTALTRREDPIRTPARRGWLDPQSNESPILNSMLLQTKQTQGSCTVCPQCDAVVFALSGKPFQPDDSTEVVQSICKSLPQSCESICLVSAYGVGGEGDVAISVMREWYLKSTYRAKKEQEDIVQQYDNELRTCILRPRVLSYTSIPFNTITTPRCELAGDILDWVDNS